MYPIILVIHNALRWLVLGSLLAALVSAYAGWFRPVSSPASTGSQTLRVVATSLSHTQLLVGLYLYTISPVVKYYWRAKPDESTPDFNDAPEFSFFGFIHIGLMFTSVVLMTIGSSKAKRQTDVRQRDKTTAIYFTIGLLLILAAIPWPFSPLAARPWTRTF